MMPFPRRWGELKRVCGDNLQTFVEDDTMGESNFDIHVKRIPGRRGPFLQRDGGLRQDSDFRAVDLRASARQSVLGLEAQGLRRRRRSKPCLGHHSGGVGGSRSRYAHLSHPCNMEPPKLVTYEWLY